MRWLDRVARGRSLEAAGSVAVTARLVQYSILCIGFGVIIGFAMQNIASNFVSWVILLFERTIKELTIRSTIARSINEAIWWALKKAGITIAFPQLDVHFDPEIERSMTALVQA